MSTLAYIGVGGNLDHPRRHVARALAELARLPGSQVVAASPNYVSAPIGASEPQPDYVNAVAALRTRLTPRSLLARMHSIERRHRRARVAPNAPRTLDLDLLLFGRRRVAQSAITLPHPRMHQRAFVLKPLRDVAPNASIPGYGAVRPLLRSVRDQRIARTRRHAWR